MKTTFSKEEAYTWAVDLIKKSALESNKFSQIHFSNKIQYREQKGVRNKS